MRKLFLLNLVNFFLLLSMSSCTTITPPQAPQKKSSQQREQGLSAIQSFQLNGKIAVQTQRDSGSATINWKQKSDRYFVSLYGPLGAGGMSLSGESGHVVLKTTDGKHFSASSPEELLAKHWGFNLPVSNLRYWVRGMPVPGIAANTHYDSDGRLTQVVQAGWNVQYLSYKTVRSVDLPTKIAITSSSLRAKIIIYQWTIGN